MCSHRVYLKVIWLQHPGVVFPHLQEIEKRFFEIVADGNVAEVRSFLEDQPEFNINATNFQVSTISQFPSRDKKTYRQLSLFDKSVFE